MMVKKKTKETVRRAVNNKIRENVKVSAEGRIWIWARRRGGSGG